MTANILGSLVIVGVAVSLLVQFLKQHFGGGAKTQAIVLVLSVLGGVVYHFFQAHPAIWQNVLTILATADVVYSFVIKYFESGNASTGNNPF